MDKYDYITATIEDEKIRLEKILDYLRKTNSSEITEYQERYNTVLKYLNKKEKYLSIENNIREEKIKLEELKKIKDEYELDNILLEDTLLSKFHEDTENVYRNLLYDNIKNEDISIRNILYLLFEKQSSYIELVIKRNRLKSIIDKRKYPSTYNTLISQGILIEKQNNIMDEIFLIENNIKVEEEKRKELENEVMATPILKLLYEFWIIDSYDKSRVNRKNLFKDNRTLTSIKNDIPEIAEEEVIEIEPVVEQEELEVINEIPEIILPDLNLPGINEDTLVDIDGKNYIKNDK